MAALALSIIAVLALAGFFVWLKAPGHLTTFGISANSDRAQDYSATIRPPKRLVA